jgi:antitoxin component of RelBE/YafQ-DinJ toxin-antitoxin module
MSTTKTVSTRIDDNVHTLFTNYCNQKGRTMSQMLNLFINDIVTQNKDSLVSSQCSIDSDEEKESTKTQNFSQDEPLEEELKPRKTLDQKIRIFDSKKARVNMVHEVNQDFIKHVDEIKEAIKNLKTSMDKKLEEDNMKKGMACFDDSKSCFTT